jgi:hypothetical protein
MTSPTSPSPEESSETPLAAAAGAAPPGGEGFIPLRKSDLASTLAARGQLDPPARAAFDRFCRLLHAVISAHLQASTEGLKEAYAPFDPDADTREGQSLTEAELDSRRAELFDRLAVLLKQANYYPLAEEQISRALNDRTHWGLHLSVDFTRFDRLELYYRGNRVASRFRRRLRNRFRNEAIDVAIYQRLVVIFRLKPEPNAPDTHDSDAVYIKLFKDIPQLDLDMLLPGSKVRMSMVDRARVMIPTVSGVGIALYKMLATVAFGSKLAYLGLIGGTLGYGARSLFGYFNTRQKYQLNLTQSLYFQNIDNNAGVLHRLLDAAAEQENREVILAYFFLWREAPPEGWTAAELDAQIESWLLSEAEQKIDFEIWDALDKLSRFRLATQHGDRWQAVPIDHAVAALARHWDELPDTWQ